MSRPSALDVFRGPESSTGGGLGRGSTLALKLSGPPLTTTLQTLQSQMNETSTSLASLCKSVNQKADYLATNEALLRVSSKGDTLELGRYIQREVVGRLETLGETQSRSATRTSSLESRLEVLEKLATGQAKRIEELENELRGVKGVTAGGGGYPALVAEMRGLVSSCAPASTVAQLEEKCGELSSSIVTLAKITDTAAEVHAKTATATLATVVALRERMNACEEATGDLMEGLGIPSPRDEKGATTTRKPATTSAAKSALQAAADTALKGKLYSMKVGLEALVSGAKERLASDLSATLAAGLTELKEEVGREVRRGRAMRVEMAQVISAHRQAPEPPLPTGGGGGGGGGWGGGGEGEGGAGNNAPLSVALQAAIQAQVEQMTRATSSPVRHLALDVAKQVCELQEEVKETSLKVAAAQGELEERVSGLKATLSALETRDLEVLTPGLDRVTKAVGELRGDLSSVLALKLSPPPPSTPPRQVQHQQPPSRALMGLLASPPPMLEPGGGSGGVIAGRWMWRRRGLHKDSIVAFDVEALNTDKGLLAWGGGGGEEGGEEGGEGVSSLEKRAQIVAHRQGLYRVTTAFFAYPLPRISVLVNAQPACLLPTPCDGDKEEGGSGRGCVYSHEYGTVAGTCNTFFLSLPAKAVVQIGYQGTEGQGFLELSKL